MGLAAAVACDLWIVGYPISEPTGRIRYDRQFNWWRERVRNRGTRQRGVHAGSRRSLPRVMVGVFIVIRAVRSIRTIVFQVQHIQRITYFRCKIVAAGGRGIGLL
jgi:hypothetical protein